MKSILKNISIIALMMLAPLVKAKDLTKVGLGSGGIGSDVTVGTKGVLDPEGGGKIPGAGSGDSFLAKLVHDPIGTAKLTQQIEQYSKMLENGKEQLGVLDAVNNEINGIRGQLMNVYNQSFGFIGAAARLREDVIDFKDSAVNTAESIAKNLECINEDLSELGKKELLLQARAIDYSSPEVQKELAQKGYTTFFQKYLGSGVYIPANVNNLSTCGSIETSRAAMKVEEINKIIQQTFKEETIKGLKKVAESEGKSTAEYKVLSEMLTEFIDKTTSDKGDKTMAEIAADELELLTIMALNNMEIATHTKNLVILEINKQKDAIYGEYARELMYEREMYGMQNVGKEMSEDQRRKAERVNIATNPNQGLFTPRSKKRR